MKSFTITCCVLLLCGALLATLSGQLALFAQEPAEQDRTALLVKLAEARLALATTELSMTEAQNKAVPGVTNAVTVEQMRLAVVNAQASLDAARKQGGQYSLAMLRPGLESAVKTLTARTEREEALAASTADPMVINSAKMSRARLEVAKAELASLDAVASAPMDAQIQWQLERLSTAIDRLMVRVTVLEDKR